MLRALGARPLRLTLGVAAAIGVGVGWGPLWRATVLDAVEEHLSNRAGRRVSVGGLHPGVFGWVASDVEIAGAPPFADSTLARAERVVWSYGGASLDVHGLDVDYARAGGIDNLRGAARSLPAHGRGSLGASSSSWPASWPALHVHDGRVRAFLQTTAGARLALRGGRIDLDVERGGGVRASIVRLVAEAPGLVTLEMPAVALDGMLGSADAGVALRGQGGSVRLPGAAAFVDGVQIDGSVSRGGAGLSILRGAPGTPGAILLRLDASGDGMHLAFDTARLPLGPLDGAARRVGLGLARAEATVRGSAELAAGSDRVDFDLDGRVDKLDLLATAFDRSPWEGISLAVKIPGHVTLTERPTVDVTDGRLTALGVPLRLAARVALPAPVRGSVRLDTVSAEPGDGASLPAGVPCEGLLAAQAGPVKQVLAGMQLGGQLAFSVTSTFNAANLEAMTLGLDVPQLCTVVREPDLLDRVGVRGDDVAYEAVQPDGARTPHPLGPAHPSFARLAAMPSHLPAAFMTAEDAHFQSHKGFDLEMIRRALVYDLQLGSFAKGASTISQQLAKNLFLARHRTLARKLEETVLTWRLEHVLTKPRILELYLNAVELGPGVYGVKEAAQFYFGKPLAALTPLEAVHLAALAPNPRGLAQRFSEGRVDTGWLHHLYDLLAMMRRSGRLSAEQLAAATSTNLKLRRI